MSRHCLCLLPLLCETVAVKDVTTKRQGSLFEGLLCNPEHNKEILAGEGRRSSGYVLATRSSLDPSEKLLGPLSDTVICV